VVQNGTLTEKTHLMYIRHNIWKLDTKQHKIAAITFQMIWKTIK